jgi:flagellar export protein FliJ
MQNCWTVLAGRAKTATNDAHAIVVAARTRVTQLQGSLDHLEKLRLDYVARYQAAQKEAHMIGDNLAYRQFLDHLQTLNERVMSQMSAAQQELARVKKAWAAAQLEQVKMEAMVERDLRNELQEKNKREQKESDAAGITLFNLR